VLSIVTIGGKLAFRWRDVVRSDVVLVMHQGGFGHTIHHPDLARRMFPGKRILCLCMFQRAAHNPLVARIWPDVQVIFLPIAFAWGRQNRKFPLPWFPGWKSLWLHRVLKRWFPTKMVLSIVELNEITRHYGHDSAGRRPASHWAFGYFELMRNVAAPPPPRLPLDLRRRAERAIRLRCTSADKLCCLYLRVRGAAGDGDPSSWRRIGSPLQQYWPAVRALNSRGYTVLLVGDRVLDRETAEEFGDRLLDAASLRLSCDLLYLYAALQSDVAILECGGGSWLPIYRNMPHLVVNVLPYEFASPGGTIYYKAILRPDGEPEEPNLLFGAMVHEYDFSGHVVKDNNEEELEEAVADFIDNLDHPRPWGVAAADICNVPDGSWHRAMKSAVSPVWLKRYGKSIAVGKKLQNLPAGSDLSR
jgi:hypothetical protein